MTISIRPTGTLQYTNVAGWKKHSHVKKNSDATVDGRNPAPAGMYKTL